MYRQLSLCLGMTSKSEKETNTQEVVTDSDALTAEDESHPGEEGRVNRKISDFCPRK